MIINIGVSISFLIVLFILILCFFSKMRVVKYENTIFIWLIFLTSIGLSIESFIYLITICFKQELSFLLKPLVVLLFIYYVVWMYFFVSYNLFLLNENIKNKKNNIFLIGLYAIFLLTTIVLPFELEITDFYFYPQGIGTYAQYIFVSVGFIIITIYSFTNFKKLKNKDFIPLIVCMLLGIGTSTLQYFRHEFMFIVPSHAIAVMLMYFTIENPDIKIAKDLAYAKALIEKNQNKTLKTLNDISNDLRSSLNKLESFGYKKLDKNNIDKLNEEVKYIQNYSIKIADRINGIIDLAIINNTDELKEEKYETYNMFEDLKHLLSLEKANKKISLITNMKDNISPVLYGDKDKVEHIIIYFFSEIINIIKNGKITLNIYSIEVGRFCRLRFHFLIDNPIIKEHIEKSKNSDILKLVNFGDDLDYKVVKELLNMFKGKIDISENESNTTEIILSLDQRVKTEYQILSEKEENKNVKIKYFDLSDKRILIVDDNVVKIRELQAMLKPYKIKSSYVVNIEQMRKELSSNTTYDLILVDDIIPNFKSDGSDLIKNEDNIVRTIRLNANYKVPTVLMVTDNTKHFEDEYIKYGFNSCITKPVSKKGINDLLIEYFR